MSAINPAIRPAISAAIRGGFELSGGSRSPTSLFAASEVGVWYAPSDLSTMFQDAYGSTPVTADGQSVGLILDKSKGLTLDSDLVTNGNFSNGTTGFTNVNGNTSGSSVISGEFNVVCGGGGSGGFTQDITITQGTTYKVTVTARKIAGSGYTRVQLYDGASFTNFILQLVDINSVAGAVVYTAYVTPKLTSTLRLYLYADMSTTGGFDDITVKALPGNHATQATAAKRPVYKTSGGLHWLQFDGVDDAMATGIIDFSATDEMSVFAGVRKTSDSAQCIVAELSATIASNNGSWALSAPVSAAANYDFSSKGTSAAANTVTTYTAPITNVITGLADISGDSNIIRVNGAQVGSVATDQGAGNYGSAYPLYIGGRAGTSLFFSGNIYSLIVRNKVSTTGEITSAESYVAGKSGVVLP